jgi:hypothetical protein
MNPESVLEDPPDRNALLGALVRFAGQMATAAARQAALRNAGVSPAGINYADDPFTFASTLMAALVGRPIAEKGNEAHSLVGRLDHWPEKADEAHPLLGLMNNWLQVGPENYGLLGEDADLFRRLLAQGRDRVGAGWARRSVGKLEDDAQNGIGTGVLVGHQLLLTCYHVLTKTGVKGAWVRFGFKTRLDQTVAPGERFELDLEDLVARGGGSRPDYALIRLRDDPGRPPLSLAPVELNSGQAIRIIHYPHGRPAVVSETGRVHQLGADYLHHDLSTDEGSSGGPIFDRAWKLAALHRGHTVDTPRGLTAGVPLHAFREDLTQYLTP